MAVILLTHSLPAPAYVLLIHATRWHTPVYHVWDMEIALLKYTSVSNSEPWTIIPKLLAEKQGMMCYKKIRWVYSAPCNAWATSGCGCDIEQLQRGVTEAQNGNGFGMLPGHGLCDGYLSSLALDGSPACKLPTALELERSPSWRPCLMHRSENPTFHSQVSIPDHPLHQISWFLVFWCSCDQQTSLQHNWSGKTQQLVRCAFALGKIAKMGQ